MTWELKLQQLQAELQSAIAAAPGQPPRHLYESLSLVMSALALTNADEEQTYVSWIDIFLAAINRSNIDFAIGSPNDSPSTGTISSRLATIAEKTELIGNLNDAASATGSTLARLRAIAELLQRQERTGRFINSTDASYSLVGATRRFTVPANRRWTLKTATFTYVSSATAGNRFPGIYIASSSGDIGYRYLAASQAASITRLFSIGDIGVNPAAVTAGSESHQHLPLPDLDPLPAGSRIEFRDNAAIDTVGDAINSPILYVGEQVV